MTVDTIRDLSDRLERHQTAFYKGEGFESLTDCKLLPYLGYGRSLVLPDGQSYEAYLKGWESILQITFVGPRNDAPDVKTDLGGAQFVPQGRGLEIRGSIYDDYTHRRQHDFPASTELLKPFGAWASDGLARELSRKKANVKIELAARKEFCDLETTILTAGKVDKMTLVKQSTAKLTEIINDVVRQLKQPDTTVPSVEGVAFLEEFISHPENTTAAYIPCIEPAVGLQVINVPGPLLS